MAPLYRTGRFETVTSSGGEGFGRDPFAVKRTRPGGQEPTIGPSERGQAPRSSAFLQRQQTTAQCVGRKMLGVKRLQ